MIPEFPVFKPIEIEDRDEVEAFTKNFLPYSDFNFTTLWIWNLQEDGGFSQLNGNLIVRFTDCVSGQSFYSFIGSNAVSETIDAIFSHCKENGIEPRLKMVPEFMTSWYVHNNSKIVVTEDSANFDYVYSVDKLLVYSGGEYKEIRNLMKRFLQTYEKIKIVHVDINELATKKLILEVVERWKKDKNFQLDIEDRALERLFNASQDFSLLSLLIYVNGSVVAFSINEGMHAGYAITHFAKGDVSYRGIYSYLMWATANMLSIKGYSLLNYEEDLGIDSLRVAKRAYAPVLFLKKCSITPTLERN